MFNLMSKLFFVTVIAFLCGCRVSSPNPDAVSVCVDFPEGCPIVKVQYLSKKDIFNTISMINIENMGYREIENYKKMGYAVIGEVEAKLEIYENSSGQWQKAKEYSYSYDFAGDSCWPRKKENIATQTYFKEAIECLIPENTTKIMVVINPNSSFLRQKYYVVNFFRHKLPVEGGIKLFLLLDYGTYLRSMNIMLPEWNDLPDFSDIILENDKR